MKRILFLGSSCIYPKNIVEPIEEELLLSGPLEKTNEQYALAKIAGIKLCEALSKQYDLDAISLMPTNLYGPGDNYHPENSHVMAAMIKRFSEAKRLSSKYVTCWGTGKPLREFLHVDDLASAAIFCLENWDPDSIDSPRDSEGKILNYLNVGTGKDISIKNLAELIAKLTKYKGLINWDLSKPDGTPRKLLNVERIKKLGWKPTINLKEGIERTLSEMDQKI